MSQSRPPGPDGWPLVGNTIQYVRNPFDFRQECVEKYGDVVYMKNFGVEVYMLAHPEYFQRVLVSEADEFTKHQITRDRVGKVFGNGLLLSRGDFWERQREYMQPMFRPERVQTYAEMMTGFGERKIDEWESGETYELKRQMKELTLQITIKALFGIDLKYDDSGLGYAIEDLFAKFEPSKMVFPYWVPTPTNIRLKRAKKRLENSLDDMIERRRAADDLGEDLLSRLIDANAGDMMTDREMKDEMINMVLAGHETTGLVLTYTLYLLSEHPEIRRELVEEVDEVVGDETPTTEHLEEMDYLEQVLNESMRLYSPTHTIAREPLEDVEFDGYTIPEGSYVALSAYVVHHDDRWYDDPFQFKPERWTDDLEDELPGCAYVPFGAGPRRCIGDHFGWMEARLLLVQLLQNVQVDYVADHPMEVNASLTIQPKNPVTVQITER
ncbi:cytochrome P450 [Halobacteriales archaeon QS_1_68_20]|nr:MAG: cytochrome P450 [Halobacteriales archaeon QS_1_68_20]